MAKFSRLVGATSQSINVFIQNSSSTTGGGLTGLVFSSSGLTAYYSFTGANAGSTQITLVTLATISSAYSSGGFKEMDATNMPGVYRLDIPNAMLAASKGNLVTLYMQGATNMAPNVSEIELTAIDNQSTTFGLATISANVAQWNGTTVATPATAGIPDVNMKNIANAAVSATTAQIGTNVVNWNNTVVATPATAGIPDINVKNMNNVAATSITTINANQGTTQPINFTGTSTSALVKSDMIDIASAAVSASTAQLGVNLVNIAGSAVATGTAQLGVNLVNIAGSAVSTSTAQLGVNIVNIKGTASAGTAGYAGVDWSAVNAPTSTVGLTGTTISTTQVVASVTGAVGSVTGAVGSVTGAVGSVTGAVGSVTGNVGGTVASVVGAVGSVTGSVGSISGVTFPSHFSSLAITAGGAVAVDGTSALTESYAPVGSALTLSQFAYGLTQQLGAMSISGTTMTVLKRDNSTTAKTYTLNSSTTPTSVTEAS